MSTEKVEKMAFKFIQSQKQNSLALFSRLWIVPIFLSVAIRLPSIFRGYFTGPHQGRQMQTLWPVYYWTEHGFSPLHSHFYISGKNQIWDMEFPVYQWICFGIHEITGINLVIASKLITLVASVISAILVFKISQKLNLTYTSSFCALLVFCLSPFSLYWGSVGMIDNLAIALGLFALNISFDKNSNAKHFVYLTSLILATLIKPNIGATYFLVCVFLQLMRKGERFKAIFLDGLFIFSVTLAWSIYAKFDSSLGTVVSGLTWFFGTPKQYLETPYNFVGNFSRLLPSIIGLLAALILIFGITFLKKPREYSVLLVACLFEVLVFANVNFQDYYQISIIPIVALLLAGGFEGYLGILAKFANRRRVELASLVLIFVLLLFSSKDGISTIYIDSIFNRAPDQSNKYYQGPNSTSYKEFMNYTWKDAQEPINSLSNK